MNYFAEKLKELRQSSDMSMQELADKASVSKSMICKIERNEVQPTIDVAGRLAKALGRTLSEMLHVSETAEVVYLPKEEQALWADPQKVKRRNISPVFEGLKLEWLLVEFPPNISIPKLAQHTKKKEEKYVLVNKGILEVIIGQNKYKLKKGDSLYFDSKAAHTFRNPGKEITEFFMVIRHD